MEWKKGRQRGETYKGRNKGVNGGEATEEEDIG